jgi:hypothetical protein
MANEEQLELAKKMDNRFLEVVGKPYEHVGKGNKRNSVGIAALVKEFKVSAITVNDYLTVFHQPPDVLRMIESGGWWSHWKEAVHAPKSIQPLLFQKIKNKEFASQSDIRKFIEEHKNMTEASEVVTPVSEIPGIGDVPPQPSWSEYIRGKLDSTGSFDPVEGAKQRFNDTTPQHVSNMVALVYNLRSTYAREFNKALVRRDGVFYVEDIPEPQGDIVKQETPSKTKVAVLVAREVRDNGGTRYELDIVGDFNRGMMKEALKSLMEVLI